MAEQFTGLFIPLFLFTLSKQSVLFTFFPNLSYIQKGILYVCIYYLLWRVLEALILFPLSHLTKRLGLTKSMIFGNVFRILDFLALLLSIQNELFIIVSIVFRAIEMGLYWPSYYTQFALRADLRSLGRNVGSMYFLEKLIRVLLPMLGGTVIALFGFSANYIMAIFAMVFSIFFLFATTEVTCSYAVSLKDFLAWIKNKNFKKYTLAFLGWYIDTGAFILWTIYAFIFFGSIERVGYVFSIVLFISLVLSYFMGWYLGKYKGKRLLVLSGGILCGVWVMRMFIQSIWHFIMVDIVDRLAVSIYQPIFDTFFLRESRKKSVYHFHVYREIILSCSACLFWSIAMLIFILPLQWTGLFIFGGFGVLLSLYMSFGGKYR